MKQLLKKTLSLGLSALLMLSFLPPTEAKAANNQDDRRIIVAMGDSYSSGEGIEPFFHQGSPIRTLVNENDWMAHRSQKAWSGMLELPDSNGNIIKMSDYYWDGTNDDTACWYFVAASGAETWNINGGEDSRGNIPPVELDKEEGGKQKKTYHEGMIDEHTIYLPKQCDVFDKLGNINASYVTLTIGGNDAGFQDIMREAATGFSFIDPMHLRNRIRKSVDYIIDDEHPIDGKSTTPGLARKIETVYRTIDEKANHQTTIIVAGYPQLVISETKYLDPLKFGENNLLYGLTNEKCCLFDKDERELLNWAVTFFNDVIRKTVSICQRDGIDIHYVSVAEEFLNHEPGTKNPYLNGVLLSQSQDLSFIPPLSAYSFHPNEEGAKAYARCVQAKIDELEGIERDPNTGEVISVNPSANSTEDVADEPSGYLFFDSVDESNRQKLLLKETTYRTDTEDSIEPDCQYTLFALNSNNERVALEKISFSADLHIETSYDYDNNGHLIYDNTNSNAGAHWYNEYLYSGDNLARINHFLNDELLMYTEYNYNETNRLEKELRYDWDGHLDERIQYSYDDLDRLSESFSEHNPDTESWYCEWNYYFYDQYNRINEIQRFEHPPDYYQRAVYEYDSNGNTVRVSIFSEDGKLVEYTLYEYGDVTDYLDEIARLCSSMPMEHDCICKLPLFSSMLAGYPADSPSHIGYYEVFDGVAGSWMDAQKYCESVGGHLATIGSEEENETIYQVLINTEYESAYFGLTDKDDEGVWKWVNGEPVEYTNWAGSEPNSENPNEDYAMFYFKYADGKWNDGDFGGRTASGGTAFICEWDTDEAYHYFIGTNQPAGEEPLVKDRCSSSFTTSKWNYSIEVHIPTINLVSDDARTISNEIYELLKPYDDDLHARFDRDSKLIADAKGIYYDWSVDGDVLSLDIIYDISSDIFERGELHYRFSISSGKCLNPDQEIGRPTQGTHPSPVGEALYIPALEKIIGSWRYQYNDGYGMLYDLDDDGARELILLYDVPEDYSVHYSIYGIRNGQVFPLKENEYVVTKVDACSGQIGIVRYNGKIAFEVWRHDSGLGAVDYDEIHILASDTLAEIASFTREGVWSYSQSEGPKVTDSKCTFNGNNCTYDKYQTALLAIEEVDMLYTYVWDEQSQPMVSGMDFYDLLRYLQRGAGITASKEAVYSLGEAEAVANDQWESYLARNQGFDWAIIKQNSLIKDGIEYYCFTLQNNSGGTWQISKRLFFNSVTGEYEDSLF